MRNFFRKIREFIICVFLLPVKFYRKFISPLKPGCCKYTPTCSEYFISAVKEWGIFIGSAMGIWRILRCNPFSKGGYDPVPLRKKKKQKKSDDDEEKKDCVD